VENHSNSPTFLIGGLLLMATTIETLRPPLKPDLFYCLWTSFPDPSICWSVLSILVSATPQFGPRIYSFLCVGSVAGAMRWSNGTGYSTPVKLGHPAWSSVRSNVGQGISRPIGTQTLSFYYGSLADEEDVRRADQAFLATAMEGITH
jgi:hypothetical protein